MTPEEIAAKARALQKQEITMSNYKQIVNDTLVLVRELAKNLSERAAK